MPLWHHPTRSFPNGRVTVSAGEMTVGLNVNADKIPSYGWHDAPGKLADLHINLIYQPGPWHERVEVSRYTSETLVFHGQWCRGHFDRRSAVGEVTIFTGHEFHAGVYQWGALEAGFMALAALTWWRGGLLLHAATIENGGGALVICGESGRGKTTLARRNWAKFLNEEHAFVTRAADGRWRSHWYSQSRCPPQERPAVLDVVGLRLLSDVRDQTALRPCSASEAYAGIVHSAVWLPGMPLQTLIDRVAALCDAYDPLWFDHSLQTPVGKVFDVLAQESIR
ncbi:MAG TPA: hypothetical protein DCQ06_04490 [Myxococcales bacterium]|nr:hypothetical protein [Myxococcales bacterium]